MELKVMHKSFIEIPNELLYAIDNLNREEGIPLTILARRNNISYTTLQRRMKKLRDTGKLLTISERIFNSVIAEENEKYRQRRLKMQEAYKKIRSQFKVGQKVCINYLKSPKDGQMYLIKGDVEVQGVYKQFIVVQRQGELGIVKESINYSDIYTKVVEVKVI